MNEAMLQKLVEKGFYNKVFRSQVGGGHRIESIPDNSYDVVAISGGFIQGHLPCDSLREVARILKAGKFYF